MPISGMRKLKGGGFAVEVMVRGTNKLCAKRATFGLGTRSEIEASARAKILKNGLARCEMIQSGLSLPRGRPKNTKQ